MKDIKAIVFDLGNVLFDLDIPLTWRALEKIMDVTFEHPFGYPPTKEIMYDYECGKIDTGTFIGVIQRLCKREITAEQIVNAWNAMLLTMPAARFEFLATMKSHFPLYLLSNINSLHLEYFYRHIRDDHGIINWDKAFFQQTFYSNLLGMRKPEKEMYEHVLAEIDYAPESVLFIDDNPHNIASAKSMGIQTILLGEKEEVMDQPFFQSFLKPTSTHE